MNFWLQQLQEPPTGALLRTLHKWLSFLESEINVNQVNTENGVHGHVVHDTLNALRRSNDRAQPGLTVSSVSVHGCTEDETRGQRSTSPRHRARAVMLTTCIVPANMPRLPACQEPLLYPHQRFVTLPKCCRGEETDNWFINGVLKVTNFVYEGGGASPGTSKCSFGEW